jgi:hypothetical protein
MQVSRQGIAPISAACRLRFGQIQNEFSASVQRACDHAGYLVFMTGLTQQMNICTQPGIGETVYTGADPQSIAQAGTQAPCSDAIS